MARLPALFRQADVTRAVKGARAAGFDVKRIEIDRQGRILIASEEPRPEPAAELPHQNPWDDV